MNNGILHNAIETITPEKIIAKSIMIKFENTFSINIPKKNKEPSNPNRNIINDDSIWFFL